MTSTLLGGAVGWLVGGAPTVWKKVSAFGISTMPAIVTVTSARPAVPMVIVSPGAACRLAAVCCATRMPSVAPVSGRSWSGNVVR